MRNLLRRWDDDDRTVAGRPPAPWHGPTDRRQAGRPALALVSDAPPPPPAAPDGVLGATSHAALRGALLAALEAQRLRRAPDGAVRAGLHAVSAEARRRGVPVARLLVALKAEWRRLPGVGALEFADAEAALAGVVTTCIEEFYRPGGAPGA